MFTPTQNPPTSKVQRFTASLTGSAKKSAQNFEEMLREVCGRVAPVWPLSNFIAVNPLQGFEGQAFASADEIARNFFRASALPKLSYFHRKFQEGRISEKSLRAVASEHAAIGLKENIAEALKSQALESMDGDAPVEKGVLSLCEWSDELLGTRLSSKLESELVKWCGAYFDLGEAAWAMPGRNRSFFTAWKDLVRFDRSFENAGVSHFRRFVAELPEAASEVIAKCLDVLGIPAELRRDYLLRHLCTSPGWAGLFVHYGAEQQHQSNSDALNPVVDYLAVRLAYDAAGASAAVVEKLEESHPWNSLIGLALEKFASVGPSHESDPVVQGPSAKMLWLEAFEKDYRDPLLARLGTAYRKSASSSAKALKRPDVQGVFCIDVRSECLRRHLESAGAVETFGFAGFFAVPLAYRPLGEDYVEPQCPVLIRPKFAVADRLFDRESEASFLAGQRAKRSMGSAWKEVKNTAISPFALVEAIGWVGAWSMLSRTFWPSFRARLASFRASFGKRRREVSLSSDVEGKTSLYESGIPLPDRVAIAENSMRIMGLGVAGAPLARLILLCGHGSTTSNNAYASALDCGACGGHRGAPNARVAAAIFNDAEVRSELRTSGLLIPEDTLFVAAEHDSATDEIRILDIESLPETHRPDVRSFQATTAKALDQLNFERTQRFDVPSNSVPAAVAEVRRRSLDWSEARPEWGLAGNAAFIVGRRAVTRGMNLGGRSFLHSYRWETDPSGAGLEVIMTAPMVVTEWINMQYYFSSVDNEAFGSGSKVIHNVVGKLAVMQGNESDLKMGLPLQSVSDGKELVHEPMRLNVLIEAPKERIGAIVDKHESVGKLVRNQWLHLIALDPNDGRAYRFLPSGEWYPEVAFDESTASAERQALLH